MRLLNSVVFVGVALLAGCGKDPSSFGMLGFSLGQTIDYTDKASLQSLGITKVERWDDGSICCTFKTSHKFRKFENGNLTIDPETKKVYIVSSSIGGDGLMVAKETDVAREVMKEKFGGEWTRKKDEYGMVSYEGDFGGGVTASVYLDSSLDEGRCCIVIRNSTIVEKVKKRNLKKDIDSF